MSEGGNDAKAIPSPLARYHTRKKTYTPEKITRGTRGGDRKREVTTRDPNFSRGRERF